MLVSLGRRTPLDSGDLPPHPIEFAVEPATSRIDSRTLPPERVCVYCGHGVYAAPRAVTAFCPGCRRQVNLRNLDLHGEVLETRTMTAGTITVHRDARVSGELLGGRVVIEGRFMGVIAAAHTCTIRATGKVAGRIVCRNIVMEEGSEMVAEIENV